MGELAALNAQIQTQVDCRATLSAAPPTPLPLTCAAYTNILLKRRDGSSLTTPAGASNVIGAWTVHAECISNALHVTAARSGNNPLTQLPWGVIDVISPAQKICGEYFAPNSSCAAGKFYHGNRDGSFECCRELRVTQTATWGFVSAQCNTDEYATGGGSRCSMTNDLIAGSSPGSVHTITPQIPYIISGAYYNQWGVDCNTKNYLPPDSYAEATAICCPRVR